MRICIFGAGAIGSFLAARLSGAGSDVSVIARGPHLAAIQANGLKLIEPTGETVHRLTATDNPADLAPQDIVIVTTKAHGLPQAAKTAAPLLGPDTKVVFAQNGIPWWYAHGFQAPGLPSGSNHRIDPDRAIWDGFGPDRAIGCTIFSPNSVPAPGVVQNVAVRKSRFELGQPDGEVSSLLQQFSATMEAADVLAPMNRTIRHAVWDKLLLNVANAPITTLTGATIKAATSDPAIRQIGQSLMRETMAVAASHGFKLDADVEANTDPATRPNHKPSMLQDFEAGRPMEVDPILTCVQDFAKAAGVPTPILDIILPLATTKARTAGLYGGSIL
jgi:2-dehydropantoate 2-reductase